MKFSLQKRLSNDWSANANYTLSKCINQGEPGTDIGGGTFPVAQIDPFTNPHPDPKSNEGACAADRRHNFNLSPVLISPGFGSELRRDDHEGLAGRPHLPGAQRLADDARRDRRPRAHRRPRSAR